MEQMSLTKKYILKAALGVALISAISTTASAQDQKIGVVNLQAIVERAPQTKAMMIALQEEFAPREREFRAKEKEIEDLKAKVQKDLAVMGDTERRNAEKDLRELQRDYQRLGTEFQEDSTLRQNEELALLQRAMVEEVEEFALQNGYNLIVGSNVLYASPELNITEAILRAVTDNYQAAAQ